MPDHPQRSSQPDGDLSSTSTLHLLILEDSPADVELIVLTLETAGIAFTYDTVDTEAAFQQHLQRNRYNIILSDYRLPGFNGLRAFEILQSLQDIPFILITGSLGEESAVECIKRGMTDYVLKDRLFRLPTVVERALQEHQLRCQQRAAIAQIEQQAWRETIINQIVQAMRQTLVLQEVLQTTVDQLHEALQLSRCLIFLLSTDHAMRSHYVSQATSEAQDFIGIQCPLYPYYQSILAQDQPVVLRDADEDLLPELHDIAKEYEIRALIIMPLFYQQSYLGVICLHQCDRPRNWTENEVALVQAVADQCAIAIHQSKLYYQAQMELTERKKMEAQLRYSAFHDALTGLPNRSLFMDRLEHALNLTQRRVTRQRNQHLYQFAVLFLDLDRFKVINDSLGHVVGDQLLKQVAERLSQCLRTGDTVARLGGDEFVVLLEDIAGVHEAIDVAQRIHQQLKPPCLLGGQEVFIGVSIGIALSSDHYSHASQLLRDADTAMYRAKNRGRGCHEVFNASMHAQAMRRLQLESDLQRAVERQEFWICYQPIVALTTNKIQGFEALVRWQHPDQGLISPGEFIPIAEETGLIMPIGLWVLRAACQQLHLWHEAHPEYAHLTMNVNLSAKQFSQPDLIAQIDQVLADVKLNARFLKLEITESVLIENSETAFRILQQLQDRAIEVCIDDFGTGYSSLSYLHRFPINTLKIDRSFIAQLATASEHNTEIVKAIIHLGLNLGLGVVAEGIETAEQLSFLQASSCQYGQGYWFTTPPLLRPSTALQQFI
ncbi:MAG: EAL domain-containing protein [Elainellaceae cyanobacterium]